MEYRTIQNVHDVGIAYNGEPYDPVVSAGFYWIGDFNKTGTDPITGTGSHTSAITSFGTRTNAIYLS